MKIDLQALANDLRDAGISIGWNVVSGSLYWSTSSGASGYVRLSAPVGDEESLKALDIIRKHIEGAKS